MFVILTTKPGHYRSEPGPGMQAIEAYDYLLEGRMRARFLIASSEPGSRVRVIDDGDSALVNEVPVKFLPAFETLEQARVELEHMAQFGDLDTVLLRSDAVGERPEGHVRITLINQNHRVLHAPPNSNLLRVSLREKGGIPFKCGGGVCGTCKCLIERGLEHTDAVKPKERRHLTPEQIARGHRMACQTFVNGDVAVSW